MRTDHAGELISGFAGKRVAVLGDLILDRYVWGRASRISQEAPVPVVRVQRESVSLGGAANVLRNLVALGAEAVAFGVLGNDEAAGRVRCLLDEWHVAHDGVVRDANRRTTVKTRLIADSQQVARIDDEDDAALSASLAGQVVERLQAEFDRAGLDAVIIEDYNKGVVTPALAARVRSLCTEHDCLLAWDPHPGNPARGGGLDLFTPNRAEAFALAGVYYSPTVLPLAADAPLAQVGERLLAQWAPRVLLITLGSQGMALIGENGDALHIPTVAREVYDVSGAGDTVIATAVLALAAGGDAAEAATLANHAGGVVVGHVGTVPVDLLRLRASFAAATGGADAASHG